MSRRSGGRGQPVLRDVQPEQAKHRASTSSHQPDVPCSKTSCASATSCTRTSAATSRTPAASPTPTSSISTSDRLLHAHRVRHDRTARERARLRLLPAGIAGWMDITGEPSGPPTKSGLSLVDYSAGLVAGMSPCSPASMPRAATASGWTATSASSTPLWRCSPTRRPGTSMARSSRRGRITLRIRPWFRSRHSRRVTRWIVVGCPKEKFWHTTGRCDRPPRARDRPAILDVRRPPRSRGCVAPDPGDGVRVAHGTGSGSTSSAGPGCPAARSTRWPRRWRMSRPSHAA